LFIFESATPEVSVIIPTYNRANLLSDAINSILVQTYQNLEIIIVDDGSTDNTKDLVSEFIQKSGKKIRYIHQDNAGPAAACNNGIRNSKGRLISFLDSDDLWLPIFLETMVSELKKSQAGMAYCGMFNYDGDIKELSFRGNFQSLAEGNLYKKFVFRRGHIYRGSTITKKECFKKVGLFDENLRRNEDREFIYRFSKFYDFKAVRQPLVIIRLHGKTNPKDFHDHISYHEQIMKYDTYLVEKILNDKENHVKFFMFEKRIKSRFFYVWGKSFYGKGKLKDAKEYLWESIKIFPFNWRSWIIFVLCIIGRRNLKGIERINRIESAVTKFDD